MGSDYYWDANPLNDYFLNLILVDIDVTDKELKAGIELECVKILKNYLINPQDVVFLDFQIKKSLNGITVLGNNMLTSLWFSGIVPEDTKNALTSNMLVIDSMKIKYSKKTKKLTFIEINKKN